MILFRYLAGETLKTLAAVTVTLLVIIMSGRFIKYLAEVARGDLAPDVLFLVMLYRLPNFLEVIIPLSLFIAIMLTYGRMYVDSEMTVISACGTSPGRLARYTLGPALAVAALVGTLSLYASPIGVQAYGQLLQDAKTSQGLRAAVEGRFRLDKSSGRVTYIEKVGRDDNVMKGVFMAEPVAEDGERSLVTLVGADSGRFELDPKTGQRYLVLDQGARYVGEPGEADYQVATFERFGQWIRDDGAKRYREEADAKPTLALLASDHPEDIAALQWRVSLVLLTPVVALLALALSKTDHRSGRYGKMFPGFMLFMIYLVSLNAARDALRKGNLSPELGLWWLHLLFLALALILLYGPVLKHRLRFGSGR